MQVVHYEDNHHIAMPLSTEPLDGTCSSAESHPMTKHANLNDITICSAHGIAVFLMANMMSLIRRPFTDQSCSAHIEEKTSFSISAFCACCSALWTVQMYFLIHSYLPLCRPFSILDYC